MQIQSLAIDSSVASQVTYIPEMSLLTVFFKSGKQYRYDVPPTIWPQIVEIVETEQSFGKFFNTAIRNQYPAWRRVAQ